MKIIYIAGPYSGDSRPETIERNIREAEQYALALSDRQIGFFCSHAHTEHFTTSKGSKAPEQFYYDMGMEFLQRCEAVLAIPGWEASKGAREEVEWAKAHHMQVFYPKNPDDLDAVVQWSKKTFATKLAKFLSS